MSNALTWSETSIDLKSKARGRWRLSSTVVWQVSFVSLAAYFSQTMIFDEANWYRIDLYDAMTWGLVVTQIFTLAIYVSRHRVQSVESSLRIFLSIGALAFGLTLSAITFLIVDAYRGGREIIPLLLIAPGYCVAVFVLLVSMFLQLRLAIICLQVFRPILGRKPARESVHGEPVHLGTAHSESNFDVLAERDENGNEKYSIADIFAFTGLAAVSISAYRLVLGMVTDYDALRFLAMFYAASLTAFCVFGLLQLTCARWLKLLFIVVVVLTIAYAEFYIATKLRSPLLRFGLMGMLLCNCLIALAIPVQMWFLRRSEYINIREIS